MEEALFIYKSNNEHVVVVYLEQANLFVNDLAWEHVATVRPKEFIQKILSENRAILNSLRQP